MWFLQALQGQVLLQEGQYQLQKKKKPNPKPTPFSSTKKRKKKKKACNEVPWKDYMQLNSICILTGLASIFHWLKNFG